jgi:hypothetical protein
LEYASWLEGEGKMMPGFSSELIKVMRAALEEAMTKVPQKQASSAIKANLAACILKATAQGHVTHKAFMDAAENELPSILSLFNRLDQLPQRYRFEDQSSPAGGCLTKFGPEVQIREHAELRLNITMGPPSKRHLIRVGRGVTLSVEKREHR